METFTTFNDMLDRAVLRWGDRVFLNWTDRGQTLTFVETREQAMKTAGALASLGVSSGDRVGLFAHNGLDYVLGMFGAWRLGAISCHINLLQAEDLAYFANDSTPRVLIYTHDMLPFIEANRDQMPSIQHYLCMDGAQPGAEDWPAMVANAGDPPPVNVPCMSGAHLSYTSGSSGRPKGALLAHAPTARATNCIAERVGMTPDDVTLQPTSPASSMGLVANLLPGLHKGAQVGLMSQWEAAKAWETMESERVTYAIGNPLLYRELLQVCAEKGRAPSALTRLLSGGAPVSPALKQSFADLDISLVESYGQSELGGFVALGRPVAEPPERVNAIGPALPDKEVRVVNENGSEALPGQAGELCIRGGFMLGYWGRVDATAEVLRDGWLHTGDMGVMDEWGYITMLGRWSERIVRDGSILYPRFMEEALLEDPAVLHAAVIGSPDPALGELAKAIVTLHEGSTVLPEDILNGAKKRLEGKQSPDLIEVINEMPMTATGKIGRAELQLRERSGFV